MVVIFYEEAVMKNGYDYNHSLSLMAFFGLMIVVLIVGLALGGLLIGLDIIGNF